MEVQKILLAISLLGLAACAKTKTTSDVTAYKNGAQASESCPTESLVKTRFIVKYEDGRVQVVHSENEDVFEKEFLEPRLQEIKRVEYDSIVTLSEPTMEAAATTTNDGTWGNSFVHADVAWQQGVYGQGVIVGVVDTAVDYTHPQLASQVAHDSSGAVLGWDFIANAAPSPITDAAVEHGSHVSGIILADPTKGSLSGVAPKAKFIQASFIDENHGSMGAGIAAIKYAADHGAKIINASWGGPGCSDTLKEAIAEVGNQGVLFVAASGNDWIDYDQHPEKYSYPAVFNLANQLTVAATDAFDHLTMFSNRSFSLVHIGAPGDLINSTVPKVTDASGYKRLSGTSMAAPFVTGAAALLWSAKPNATVAQIKQAILSSTDFEAYKVSTQGRLNIDKALTEIRRIVP